MRTAASAELRHLVVDVVREDFGELVAVVADALVRQYPSPCALPDLLAKSSLDRDATKRSLLILIFHNLVDVRRTAAPAYILRVQDVVGREHFARYLSVAEARFGLEVACHVQPS